MDVVHLLAGLAAAAAAGALGRDVLLQPRVEVVLVLLVRRVGPLRRVVPPPVPRPARAQLTLPPAAAPERAAQQSHGQGEGRHAPGRQVGEGEGEGGLLGLVPVPGVPGVLLRVPAAALLPALFPDPRATALGLPVPVGVLQLDVVTTFSVVQSQIRGGPSYFTLPLTRREVCSFGHLTLRST